ncbi:MAG: MBL fold metallo-hydrolase [Chloroflexi bacterium]|nr:MBL fold metallo-hydrolase [Chloroflexota bacterium]
MVQVTCYRGVGQIGGNQFMLEDGDARLLLDFGTPFSERGRFYEEYLNPRPAFGLLDPLTMGLLPPLRGLYRTDMEQGLPDLWERSKDSPWYRDLRDAPVHGVLLSHAHLDHSGYISFLRGDIPVLASALTAFAAKAIQDSGRTDFESEVVYAVPREAKGSGLIASGDYRKVPAEQRPFQVFGAERLTDESHAFWEATPGARRLEPRSLVGPGNAGGLEVRCYPVDHSIPGACAFAIRTSAGWVAYTGDLRLHGAQGHMTRRSLQELRSLKPVLLLCEGTRADLEREGQPNPTEQDVQERARQELRSAQGLVIADFGPRNVERLLTFAAIAHEAGRALVVLAKDAYLLKAAHLADPAIPSAMDIPDLLVYAEPRLQLDRWERAIREEYGARMVGPAQVQAHQDSYVLCFSFYDLDQLPTIRPRPGSLYLYSSHEAFSEELQLDFRRLRAWLDHFGMRHVGLPLEELGWTARPEEQGLHASGHADPKGLAEVVQEIAPQVLVPVHTDKERGIAYFRQRVLEPGVRIIVPSYGGPIRV